MKTVAVIGLGIMGHGIADNFLKGGYKVVVWNRSSDKANDLLAKGATLATSVKDAVQQADFVLEVTANDQSSQQIWLGKEGILANAKPDQYLITCATLSPTWTDDLATQCSKAGLVFFDMPMTGSRIGAETGQLTLLAGGDKDKLKELSPDLKAITKEVKYFGKTGSGMRYKLILNFLQAIHIIGFGEALRMADAAGLDKKLVGDALAERPGGLVTNVSWESYKKEPDSTTFSVEWLTKDLGYAAEMVNAIEHPLLDEARRQYEEAIAKGLSQADWTIVNKL
jgi:3-hydroxyisobutyrate dehydrogenase-like beta-hydroxyacid dehydrogenase